MGEYMMPELVIGPFILKATTSARKRVIQLVKASRSCSNEQQQLKDEIIAYLKDAMPAAKLELEPPKCLSKYEDESEDAHDAPEVETQRSALPVKGRWRCMQELDFRAQDAPT